MGNVGDRATPSPEAIERILSWGAVLRGFRWGGERDVALLLHDPGADIDAWATLPTEIARQLEIGTVAVDLPGHGLSDDPWEPARLPNLLQTLPDLAPAAGRRFLIAAGDSAVAALEQVPVLKLSGLVCLSPQRPDAEWNPRRSPRVAKLFVAGSLAGSDLDDARRLATASGGWAVVTSYPVAERGTGLLASSWGGHLIEEIVAFLRDCQRRPARAIRLPDRIRPESPSAPPSCPPLPDEIRGSGARLSGGAVTFVGWVGTGSVLLDVEDPMRCSDWRSA
jgi:pimeloyl-ACP methyl ester carboxylesterase